MLGDIIISAKSLSVNDIFEVSEWFTSKTMLKFQICQSYASIL